MSQMIKEQDIQLLNDILERNYYYFFKRNNNKNLSISLFNNNNYNNSIFIQREDVKKKNDFNNSLLNLEKIIHWYIENNFCCDLYFEDFENILIDEKKFFNTLLLNIKNSKVKNIYFKITNNIINNINFNFLEEQILIFKKLNINLIFSFDIYLLTNNFTNYYNCLLFCNKYNFQIKNCISPNNIEFQQQFILFILNNSINYDNIIYYEEETEEWTENKINNYIIFLNNYFDFFYKKNYKYLIKNLLKYNNFISISDKGVVDNSCQSGQCKFYKNLHIIANDLSITMCKKIQYEELTIGYFEIIDNKITQCMPNNISSLIVNIHSKRNMTPQCEYCEYVGFCPGFCHGDVYYKFLNPLIPIRETCLLRKAKYSFILYKINQINLQNDILNAIDNIYFKNYLIDLFKNIENKFMQEEECFNEIS